MAYEAVAAISAADPTCWVRDRAGYLAHSLGIKSMKGLSLSSASVSFNKPDEGVSGALEEEAQLLESLVFDSCTRALSLPSLVEKMVEGTARFIAESA